MSIRITIAKWLAPDVVDMARWWEEACGQEIIWRHRVIAERNAHRAALIKIANSRTKNPNATVKRMADIAEAAIKSGEG